jgi:heme/copper-type cytochrome/quinol oxidase subunit 4
MNLLNAYIAVKGTQAAGRASGQIGGFFLMSILALLFIFVAPFIFIIKHASGKDDIQKQIVDFLPNKRSNGVYSSATVFSIMFIVLLVIAQILLIANNNHGNINFMYALAGFTGFSILCSIVYAVKQDQVSKNILGIKYLIEDVSLNSILNSQRTNDEKFNEIAELIKHKNIDVEYQESFLKQLKYLAGINETINELEEIINDENDTYKHFRTFNAIKEFFISEAEKSDYKDVWQNDDSKLIIKQNANYIQVRNFDNYIDVMIYQDHKVLFNTKININDNIFNIDKTILSSVL